MKTMTATIGEEIGAGAPAICIRQRRFLRELGHPREALSNITPNWFASVMGTGIVAVAGATLPVQVPGLRVAATAVWVAAALLLVVVLAATAGHWATYRHVARTHHLNPVMAHFYGAPPMAMLTVGAGTLLLGKDILGLQAALTIDWVLWFAGTVIGLATAVVVPLLQFTRHQLDTSSAFGGWLMPVVPPMVSASTGALLVPHVPAGDGRLVLVLACYAMFGLSLLASIVVIALVWLRLVARAVGEARMVPTLWIVLGPLGQSVTAANLLGGVAGTALPEPYGRAMKTFGVVYGVPVWGFALLWAGIATAITVRTARDGLPFSLTWWSFTFPVGTVVTGTAGLWAHTGAELFRDAAVAGYVALVLAWALVATRTVRGVVSGELLVPAARRG